MVPQADTNTAARGRLITIEGIDGSGKTTLAAGVLAVLAELDVEARLLREPGGVPAAERVRELVKDPEMAISGRAEALLYAAARAQLVEEALVPLLEAGTTVLLDRFVDSSLAYQGAGRALGVEAVRLINDFATGGLTPDLTLLLRIPPETGRRRSRARSTAIDRLEREDGSFFDRTAEAYAALAEAEPARFRILDATQAPEAVLEQARDPVTALWR